MCRMQPQRIECMYNTNTAYTLRIDLNDKRLFPAKLMDNLGILDTTLQISKTRISVIV